MKTVLQENSNRKPVEVQVVMPLDVGMKIDADDRVRTLYEVTERMDYRELAGTYKREARRGDASAKQMYQIVVLGFMLGQYSTRKIQSACRNDIRFMYILGGNRAPDHARIGRFIKEHLQGSAGIGLFNQLVLGLRERGEIEFGHLFVDGTKIEANANRYSFVWAKSTNKYEARVDERLRVLSESFMAQYGVIQDDMLACLEALQGVKRDQGIAFVYGRGKRKTQLQRDIEEMESLLERKGKYAGYNAVFNGRNSFSKTDPDATFMRMKEDHLKNGQLKPGYNLQLGIEGEYIVGVHLSSERSDELALMGLLESMDEGLGQRHETVTADAGYESEENYTRLRQRGQTAYIKPQNYEQSKKRKYRNNAYLRDNMPYDAHTDTYTCPASNTFQRICDTKRKSKSGFQAHVTVYECPACQGCPQKSLCTKAKGNRRIQVSKDFLALRQGSLERITTDWGKTLRLNRSIQSEGAFGVLKQDYGFRRFLRRGHGNVFTELLLYATAFDLNKLHNRMTRNLSGCVIHPLDSA